MAKNNPEIPVLHVYHSQDADLYCAKVREDKVYLRNKTVAKFINRAVITVSVRKKLPKKFKLLLYLDGKSECAKLSKESDYSEFAEDKTATVTSEFQTLPETSEKLFEPLTDEDRKTVVKREIAKQLGKFKPMETWQFILIIALLAASIAIQFIF